MARNYIMQVRRGAGSVQNDLARERIKKPGLNPGFLWLSPNRIYGAKIFLLALSLPSFALSSLARAHVLLPIGAAAPALRPIGRDSRSYVEDRCDRRQATGRCRIAASY